MEVSGQLHALAALPPGKEAPVPFDRRIGESQIQSGFYGEEKYLSTAGNRRPERWKRSIREIKKGDKI
jgi:hypothetical protein